MELLLLLKLLLLIALGSLIVELWYSASTFEQFFDSAIVLISLFSTISVLGLALLIYWLNKRNSLYDAPETSPTMVSAHEVRHGKKPAGDKK